MCRCIRCKSSIASYANVNSSGFCLWQPQSSISIFNSITRFKTHLTLTEHHSRTPLTNSTAVFLRWLAHHFPKKKGKMNFPIYFESRKIQSAYGMPITHFCECIAMQHLHKYAKNTFVKFGFNAPTSSGSGEKKRWPSNAPLMIHELSIPFHCTELRVEQKRKLLRLRFRRTNNKKSRSQLSCFFFRVSHNLISNHEMC